MWIPPLDNEQDKRTLLGIVKPFEANKGRMCLFVIRLSHASRLAVVFVVSIVSIPFRLVFRLNVLPHYIDGFLSLNILGETLSPIYDLASLIFSRFVLHEALYLLGLRVKTTR